MGKLAFLLTIFTLVGGVAFAGHAISVEPGEEPAAAPAEPAEPAAPAAVSEPAPVAPQPAPKVEVNFPSELDLYVVPAATRKVCTTSEWGFGEIRTDCRTEPIPVRQADPALHGICVIRYGMRSCY